MHLRLVLGAFTLGVVTGEGGLEDLHDFSRQTAPLPPWRKGKCGRHTEDFLLNSVHVYVEPQNFAAISRESKVCVCLGLCAESVSFDVGGVSVTVQFMELVSLFDGRSRTARFSGLCL